MTADKFKEGTDLFLEGEVQRVSADGNRIIYSSFHMQL